MYYPNYSCHSRNHHHQHTMRCLPAPPECSSANLVNLREVYEAEGKMGTTTCNAMTILSRASLACILRTNLVEGNVKSSILGLRELIAGS